jgi:isopenicillin N synthase-like dioxygenase
VLGIALHLLMAPSLVCVDLSSWDCPDSRSEVTQELVKAAEDHGFFYVTGAGISEVKSVLWLQQHCGACELLPCMNW